MHREDDGLGTSEALGGGALLVVAGGTAAALQPDHIGPILAFVGALLVAGIAAVTANHRQATSLRTAEASLKKQLDSERERLGDQLEHEKRMQDREHLRGFLDDAAAALEQSRQACKALAAKLPDGAATELAAVSEAMKEIRVMRRRVELRFGPRDHVYVAYSWTSYALIQRTKHLQAAANGLEELSDTDRVEGAAFSEADDDPDSKLSDAVSDAFHEFAEAARAEIGTSAANRSDA